MVLKTPLNANDTDTLLRRKDELVEAIGSLAASLNLTLDYSFDMMLAAKAAGVRSIELVEMLLELEAIKYTLCARRLRDEVGE